MANSLDYNLPRDEWSSEFYFSGPILTGSIAEAGCGREILCWLSNWQASVAEPVRLMLKSCPDEIGAVVKPRMHLTDAEKPREKRRSRLDRYWIVIIASCQTKCRELPEEKYLRKRPFQLGESQGGPGIRIEKFLRRILPLDTLHIRRKVQVSRIVPSRRSDLRVVAMTTA